METLHESVSRLCEDLEHPLPPASEDESYRIELDETPVTFKEHHTGKTVVSAPVGKISEMAETLKEQAGELLSRSLRLHGARLSQMALPYALSVDTDADELILWTLADPNAGWGSSLNQSLENLMNEIDYRRTWLGISPRD